MWNFNRMVIFNRKRPIRKASHVVNSGVPVENYVQDPISRIRSDFEKGSIDHRRKMLLSLQAIFDKTGLQRDYATGVPIKSGTTIIKEIQDYVGKKDADREVVEAYREYMASAVPKLDKEYVSPGGFFKIHYTLEGQNAVEDRNSAGNEVPLYIKAVSEAFEGARGITCDSRGFRTPLTDNGRKTIDVYVYDLGGKYGITYTSAISGNGKSRGRRSSCYICIDNSYSKAKGFKKERDECMKVTAAHEFFHAVQNAYNIDSDTWWREASATWNEDEIYPGINDYVQYVKRVFDAPEKSLESSSYGGVTFAKYLSEYYGGYNIIKRIWELQSEAHRNSINAIDKAIREKKDGDSIGKAFNNYTACNFNPAQYYKEGHLWETHAALQNTFTKYPVRDQNGKVNHLASNYQLFKSEEQSRDRTLKIIVNADKEVRWGFKVQKLKTADNKCETAELKGEDTGERMEITCNGFGSLYKEVCLIPANLEKDRDGAGYEYSAVIE